MQLSGSRSAITATAQTWIAAQRGGDFAFAMSTWIGAVALLLALLTWLGPEAHGVGFGKKRDAARAGYVCDAPQGSPCPQNPGFPYILEGFPTFL